MDPRISHLQVTKHILFKYLKRTLDYKILYEKCDVDELKDLLI
jgi:hypothetical protein